MVENLPASVWDMGSVPGPGGSHVLWSSWACALEPGCHSSEGHALESVCSAAGEATTVRS